MSELTPIDENAIDEASVLRAAALAAYGFDDRKIADTLVLTVEQVEWARQQDVFRIAYAKKAYERTQAQIDLTEGWDSVEENSIAIVLEALQYSKDPKFALLAARTANAAKRNVGTTARTIDPSRAGTIVHISLNDRFVRATVNNGQAIDVTPQSVNSIPTPRPLKIVDMPSPKQVTDLLGPARPLLERMKEHKISDQMEEMNFGELDVNK